MNLNFFPAQLNMQKKKNFLNCVGCIMQIGSQTFSPFPHMHLFML